ncbi:MFS general substrate transporter [Aulographum hederae CBS 113979]|uniref:MFS general substrate transporter n=1 Tax=Aulographum hederae CBS 113979 TaxID=1176131 RepID=A0A6G1GSV7_9PEZI|nr:MFS general substrate transporter [Aulographum hederae CBS 113979]
MFNFHLKSLKELDETEGTVQLRQPATDANTSTSLILLPHPNPNDPNDPLRWPAWKKHTAFLSVCAFTFLANYAIGGLSSAFYLISLEFDKTQAQTSDLLLWPILVLGVFNFFWVPLANYFGKRPVFVFASLLLSLCYLWGAVAKSFESLLWSNIIAAFAGSSTEALGAAIVNDLYFVHERGTKMGIYMSFISGGNTIGPLICGAIVEKTSWRVHKWHAFGLVFLNFLAVLFFVPETQYDRDVNKAMATAVDGASMKSSEAEEVAAEKTVSAAANEVPHPDEGQTNQIPKKTWMQEMRLWNGTAKDVNLLEMFLRPFPLIVYPAIMWAFLGYAVSLAWVVAINILNSFVLQAPPYNWGPAINGLINIPGLIGNIVGSFTGGWMVDRYSDWRAKKNNGVFQPETRLVLVIIPILIAPAGCLLFGYGVQNVMHWTTLFFGYGMVAVGLTAVPVIGMTYVSDCYYPVAPDALLLVNGLKNVVAFGFLYGVVPWVTEVGYVDSFGTQAGLYVALVGLALPLYFWGEKMRHVTSQWRIIL